MITYTTTPADHQPIPTAWHTEPRYLGYRDEDYAKPYAKFFRQHTLPPQGHIVEALTLGMSPTEWAYPIEDAARRLESPGYEPMETGWTRGEDGVVQVNILTHMPGVRPEMFSWWMSWHSRESARYKLWHPDAHQFAAWGEDRGEDRTLTDEQRHRNNVSYVDEYIGGTLSRAALHFVDPKDLGFSDQPDHAVAAGIGSSPSAPVTTAWTVHYVRPTDNGAEMRSRYWIGDMQLLDLPARALDGGVASKALSNKAVQAAAKPLLPRLSRRLISDDYGPNFLVHCGQEMNHLASFLPELYEEFKDTP